MRTYVETTGTGTASAVPDRAVLHLGVSVVRHGVTEALDRLSVQVRTLGEAVRRAGVADAGIRTTGTGVGEEWAGPDGGRSGYRADQSLAVAVDGTDRLPEVIDAAAAALGDDFRLQHLAWEVSDPTLLIAAARTAAFEDARAAATALAEVAGRGLGDVLRITEGAHSPAPFARSTAAKTDAAGFAAETGATTVEVSLVVRWMLT